MIVQATSFSLFYSNCCSPVCTIGPAGGAEPLPVPVGPGQAPEGHQHQHLPLHPAQAHLHGLQVSSDSVPDSGSSGSGSRVLKEGLKC